MEAMASLGPYAFPLGFPWPSMTKLFNQRIPGMAVSKHTLSAAVGNWKHNPHYKLVGG
jgi:hypothetical protein